MIRRQLIMKYADVIFLQGDEAEPALQIFDRGGWELLAEYLLQYDDGNDLELHNEPFVGEDDQVYVMRSFYLTKQPIFDADLDRHHPFALVSVGDVGVHEYLINCNFKLNYVGCERIVPDDE
jgi:hypothetical protein